VRRTPEGMPLADLHTHTTFSDGRLTPPGLVEKAALRGLAALAVTDHDSVGGYPLAAAAAVRYGITVIPGVELSADVDGRDVHILGYGFDPANSDLRAHLAAYREDRLERARAMVGRLETLGVPVRLDRVLRLAAGGAVGRPHVARALVEARHVTTVGQAFERYLADDGAAYVAKVPVSPEALVELVHEAGGVVVIAHPGEVVDEAVLARLLSAGIDGIETIHPSHDEVLRNRWNEVAERHGLFTTGGSDYHGFRPGEEIVFGTLGVPLDRLAHLRRRA
jgi:3',5'-nucleoside bisphosphate phosphatase